MESLIKGAEKTKAVATSQQNYEEFGETRRENPLQDYLEYLRRVARKAKRSLWELHQLYISREVARSYGLSKRTIKRLDKEGL